MSLTKKQKLEYERDQLRRFVVASENQRNVAWQTYVKPNAAAARLHSALPRSSRKDGANPNGTAPLPMKEADLLDRSTPTGAFEYGRALVAYYDRLIIPRQNKLVKIEAELQRITDGEGPLIAAMAPDLRMVALLQESLEALRQAVQGMRVQETA